MLEVFPNSMATSTVPGLLLVRVLAAHMERIGGILQIPHEHAHTRPDPAAMTAESTVIPRATHCSPANPSLVCTFQQVGEVWAVIVGEHAIRTGQNVHKFSFRRFTRSPNAFAEPSFGQQTGGVVTTNCVKAAAPRTEYHTGFHFQIMDMSLRRPCTTNLCFY